MHLIPVAALALLAAAPAFASTSFLVDFEKDWSYGESVDATYAASGVSFTNVLGLSNDPAFEPYYSNAPTMQGTAFVQLDGAVNVAAYMNVSGGVANTLSFFYASPEAVTGAIKAYSGLNGTGTLLGSFDLAANTSGGYDQWTAVNFTFGGTALSFDLSGAANIVALDNISAVPETGTALMLLAGGAGMLLAARRRSKAQA